MYITQVSPKGLISFNREKKEIVIVSDPARATYYPTIGDAMRAAIEVNDILGISLAKAIQCPSPNGEGDRSVSDQNRGTFCSEVTRLDGASYVRA